MSRCSSCDRDLPALETLCVDCYEKRRAEIGQPRSFLQNLRQFVLNPLAISNEDLTETRRVSIPTTLGFWFGGLLLCWFGGWAKSRYQYPPFSNVVLRGALLCAAIALVLSATLARRGLRLHWKVASVIFVLMSVGVAGHFYIGSSGVTTLIRAIKK